MPSPQMHSPTAASASKRLRLIVVDDDPSYLQYVTALLGEFPEIAEVVGAFPCSTDALQRLDEVLPDVVLVDIAMPGMDGIACTKEITRRQPNTAVIMVSGLPEQLCCEEVFLSGACGFLSKPFCLEQLKAAIVAAASGLSVLTRSLIQHFCETTTTVRSGLISQKDLSGREVHVLNLLVCFLSNKEIADRMNYSIPLTQKVLHTAFEKLGARTRSEAIAIWHVRSA
jgi:DNA-binding NarL/FixJ family response regulator